MAEFRGTLKKSGVWVQPSVTGNIEHDSETGQFTGTLTVTSNFGAVQQHTAGWKLYQNGGPVLVVEVKRLAVKEYDFIGKLNEATTVMHFVKAVDGSLRYFPPGVSPVATPDKLVVITAVGNDTARPPKEILTQDEALSWVRGLAASGYRVRW